MGKIIERVRARERAVRVRELVGKVIVVRDDSSTGLGGLLSIAAVLGFLAMWAYWLLAHR